MRVETVLKELEKLGSPEVVEAKKRFAIESANSHGIFMKDLKILAKKIGKNDALAVELFDTGVYEAKLLVPLLFNPKKLTSALMEKWMKSFDNWEICDSFCMSFFGENKLGVEKAFKWVEHKGEFQKRAGFVCMVSYSYKNREASNEEFHQFFPIMIKHANDDRTYVMKGINWALRQIGKRNVDLNHAAIEVAHAIRLLDTKPARWIAADALRELQNEKVCLRNYPRNIYGVP